MRDTAPHNVQVFSPRPRGSNPSQFGQLIRGGAIDDSTSNDSGASPMPSSLNLTPHFLDLPITRIPLGVNVNGKSSSTPHSSAADSYIYFAAIASLAEPGISIQ